VKVFYEKDVLAGILKLSAEESHHCLTVLRQQKGDQILILDGMGNRMEAIISDTKGKICHFNVLGIEKDEPKPFRTHLAIAPTKNMDRMEWMVEKLCEIGVDEVTFVASEHSERRELKLDRLEKIAVAALKQSGNAYKTQINGLIPLKDFLAQQRSSQKWIAHVSPTHPNLSIVVNKRQENIVLIGPEGDFSSRELIVAMDAGYEPVSLGKNTLRSETAGLLACHLINVVNRW
jgi:16S rRNA (uracil1498-N3)-methyltransferase